MTEFFSLFTTMTSVEMFIGCLVSLVIAARFGLLNAWGDILDYIVQGACRLVRFVVCYVRDV